MFLKDIVVVQVRRQLEKFKMFILLKIEVEVSRSGSYAKLLSTVSFILDKVIPYMASSCF